MNFIRRMHIRAIPMRWGTGDNYAYLLSDAATKNSWLIDPAEPKEVLEDLSKVDFNLTAIVNTHHHYDHSDGNKHFHKLHPTLPVIAGRDSPLVSYTPAHKEVLQLSPDVAITALHTPCHTQDSICYYAHDKTTGQKAVFTGDTLFTSGCGRFFEGTGAEMNSSLHILAALPKDTYVYPGHEYTKSNLKFSAKILQNEAITKLQEYTDTHEKTTGVFTIGDELEFNPFMLVDDPVVQKATGLSDPDAVMSALREMKNRG